jgi:hypothetical protein
MVQLLLLSAETLVGRGYSEDGSCEVIDVMIFKPAGTGAA